MKTYSFGLTIIILIMTGRVVCAQVALAREVEISFFSKAPMEDIKSVSKAGVSALDMDSGTIYFKVPIRSFEFEKRLMREHFNENYLESDKYPNAEFNGKVNGHIEFSKDGTYPVTVQGDLMIHNVVKNYTVEGELKVEGGEITAHSVFPVKLVDHQIKIPRLVIKNIAEIIEVTISAKYDK